MKEYLLLFSVILFSSCATNLALEKSDVAVVRINQLGYLPETIKVAVFGAKSNTPVALFSLHDALTNKVVYSSEVLESKYFL